MPAPRMRLRLPSCWANWAIRPLRRRSPIGLAVWVRRTQSCSPTEGSWRFTASPCSPRVARSHASRRSSSADGVVAPASGRLCSRQRTTLRADGAATASRSRADAARSATPPTASTWPPASRRRAPARRGTGRSSNRLGLTADVDEFLGRRDPQRSATKLDVAALKLSQGKNADAAAKVADYQSLLTALSTAPKPKLDPSVADRLVAEAQGVVDCINAIDTT